MRKTTAKAMAALLALVMLLSLAGCGHEHTWADATCTTPKTCTECGKTEGEVLAHDWQEATCAAPKTCSLCGETEGEALPHTWEDATCAAPKTCSVCGETEGEALPHTWREANFQAPQTCTVCGETEGDVLTPEFEKYSVELTPHEGEHDITFTALDDSGAHRQGKISMADFQIFESDEAHPAKDGYEYRTAVIELLVYEDLSAPDRHYSVTSSSCDYYSESAMLDGIGDTADISFTVSFNGEEYEFSIEMANEAHGWEKDSDLNMWVFSMTIKAISQVPVGYDGAIVCVFDAGIVNDDIKDSDGKYCPEELFEMNPGHYAAFRLA